MKIDWSKYANFFHDAKKKGGFEKILGREFCCFDCKYITAEYNPCYKCDNYSELQLTDEILIEIKSKLCEADDKGMDIHPKFEINRFSYEHKDKIKFLKLELIL